MTTKPIFSELRSRALIAVGGPDWKGFLHGLLTQSVETLAPGESRFAGLLTPQGRLLWDMFVIGGADGCRLDVAREHREAILQRLSLYKLRAKVAIEPDERVVSALFPQDPPPSTPSGGGSRSEGGRAASGSEGEVARGAEGGFSSEADEGDSNLLSGNPLSPFGTAPPKGEHLAVRDPRLPALGWRAYGVKAPAEAQSRDEAAYEAHRLALGVPGPADWGSERTYPIEANFDLLHGIDFKKGCFVGQETTSRMKRRGQVKNRMLPIAFEGPPPAPGAEVLAGELRAGEVCSGMSGRAMALLRLDRIAGELSVDGRPVRVERPAWFVEALADGEAA
jgi:folate-binding protein YgfZ